MPKIISETSKTLQAKFEALLFVAGEEGVTLERFTTLIELAPSACKQQLDALNTKYQEDKNSAFKIIQTADRYRLATKESLSSLLQTYAKSAINQSLSKSAVEVLSIIAYKQPITRIEIDKLRGISSTGALSTLRIFNLIEVNGKKEVPGRPSLYGTTEFFLDYLGINHLDELPPVDDNRFIDSEESGLTFFSEDEKTYQQEEAHEHIPVKNNGLRNAFDRPEEKEKTTHENQ